MSLRDELNNFLQKYEVGGEIPQFNDGGRMTPEEVKKWLDEFKDSAGYKYKDIPATSKRWSKLAKTYGIDTKDFDINSLEGLDKLAGVLQRKLINEYPEIAQDYSLRMAPTKNGLISLVDSGVFSSDELKKYGIKLDKNGLPALGTDEYGVPNDKKRALVEEINNRLNKEENKSHKNSYISSNLVDDKAYYRFADMEDVGFDSQQALEDFSKNNNLKKIGDNIYATDKPGAYLRLFVDEPTKTPFKTLEEQTKAPTVDGETTNEEGLAQSRARYRMPVLEPDQRMPLEVGVDVGYLGRVEAPNLRKLNISAEPQINANFQAGMQALNQLKNAPGMTGNAMVASVLGQIQNANNQAIGQTTAQNQNIESQIERANEQGVATADQMNLELATNYNNQWLQGDANLDAMNRMISKFNNEVAVQNYTNQKMRNYLEDSLGIVVGDGMTVSDALKVNPLDTYEKYRKMQILGMQRQNPTEEKKQEKKQRGGYIRNFIDNYNKK